LLFLAQNAPETAWRQGSARTRWGSLSAPPDPLAAVKGLGPPGGEGEREREEKRGKGEGRERKRREEVYNLRKTTLPVIRWLVTGLITGVKRSRCQWDRYLVLQNVFLVQNMILQY